MFKLDLVLYMQLFSGTQRLHVKRGTWNGMERGMEHGMERGTDVKCRNESNKRIN